MNEVAPELTDEVFRKLQFFTLRGTWALGASVDFHLRRGRYPLPPIQLQRVPV
jgi:hypothetical protein